MKILRLLLIMIISQALAVQTFAPPASLSLPAGAVFADVVITPVSDTAIESAETVVFTLLPYPCASDRDAPFECYQLAAADISATATILCDELPPPQPPSRPVRPVINIYPLDAIGAEVPVGSPNIASFRITHDFPPAAIVRLLFTLSGSASEGSDYLVSSARDITNTLVGRWFTFPAGRNEAEIVITPVDDQLIENTETVKLSLYTPPFIGDNRGGGAIDEWRDSFGFSYGRNSTATISILSDDTAPPPFALITIAATDPIGTETPPAAGSQDSAVFTLTRTGSNLGAMTVRYLLDQLPSGIPPAILARAQNGVDFDSLSGSVTFAAGASTAQIMVNPIFDLLVEPEEYVKITLQPSPLPASDPGRYVIDQDTTAVVRIGNYAPPGIPVVSFEITDPEAIEDHVPRRTGSIVVRRQGNTNDTIRVAYMIRGTAVNGVDYLRLPGFAILTAGRTASTITIHPIDDNLSESAESVGLTLLPPSLDASTLPYLVGNPSKAGVAIRDHLRRSNLLGVTLAPLTTSLERLSDGTVHLEKSIQNASADSFIIEASSDLVYWEEIGTTSPIEGLAQFLDMDAGDFPARFYRMQPAAPPAPYPPVLFPPTIYAR